MIEKRKITLFAIAFTFFVDYLSWSVVFPIFPNYFLDVHNHVFGPDVSVGTRTMLLGFFLTAFSLGQFLGAPLIGEYADKHGRKRALALSVLVTFLGLCLTAYSMKVHDLYWLFAGRLITGICSSSTTVCLSSVSDLSENEQEKVKNFGLLSMIAGLAFVLGAFVGGQLSDRALSSYFSANVPISIAAIFTFFNFIFVLFSFKETSKFDRNIKFHFLESFQHVKLALKTENIKRIYTIYFLFFMAWTILFQFIPVLTIEKFYFTNSTIGYMALFMGASWTIGSGYLNQFLASRFKSMMILECSIIGFTLFSTAVVFPKQIFFVLLLIGLSVLCGSVAWPICTGLISNKASPQMQGKVLGLSQSVQSLAMTIGPVIGGLAFQHSLHLPFLLAGFISLLSVLIYYFVLKGR